MRTLILNRADVAALLSMRDCIVLMEQALASLARGEVILPLRPVLRIPDTPNVFALMPAYSKALDAIGTKLITVYPGNHGHGVDSHQGAVVLIDGANGSLLALMDASSITAIRTAAVSAVATKLLAREDAGVLAILGSGVQGRTHVEAMLAVRRFREVRLWSRDPEHAHDLSSFTLARLGDFTDGTPDVVVMRSAERAVRGADVVCTVTAAREPVLMGDWLTPGTHLNAVGASLPTTRELDTAAVARSRLFVDRRESALNEAGDLLIPISEGAVTGEHIVAEIGALLTGTARGRTSADEITLFKSLGLAIEDLACAHHLHARATRDRTGTWVDL